MQKSMFISVFTSVYSLNLNVTVNKDSMLFIQYTVSYTVYLNRKLMNENLNIFKLNKKEKSFI